MRATDFEFRNRVWLFGAIFGVAFFMFTFDHTPLGVHLADWLVARFHGPEAPTLRIIFSVGALIMVSAAAWRTWASAYLGRETVHDHALHSEVLRADGPFRHVRNPLYVGNIWMALAMALIAPVAGAVFVLIAMPLFCYRLIGREEAGLEAEQGERFRAFVRAVPRLWVSLRARIPASGAHADWRNGLASEAFFWSFALGYVAFAVTFNILWFYAGLVASPLLSWLAGLMLGSRTSSAAPD